ncbi:DUF6624 domain-containing protein [Streptomyces alfalfae]|uniref:Uncharacterized protein n=1 Tax=Streptomyces alfalfae TaxID=1642299 RepID=A0A7T4PL78_9ACTN|nr:DUF6624 domain-containing protein [Streptomyces alfalfae]QQC92094.1 hypothetical protein I8755_29620 [Streptomyces alfalfae]
MTTDPVLAARLRQCAVRDQELAKVPGKTAEDVDRWMRVAAENERFLWDVLHDRGWPGHTLVGEQGSADAMLVVQHASQDRKLQRFALGCLIEAVDAGDADAAHVAYLTDRIHLHARVPLRYGTQYERDEHGQYRLLPVEDPETLDERRARMGLEPLDVFERRLREVSGRADVLEERS